MGESDLGDVSFEPSFLNTLPDATTCHSEAKWSLGFAQRHCVQVLKCLWCWTGNDTLAPLLSERRVPDRMCTLSRSRQQWRCWWCNGWSSPWESFNLKESITSFSCTHGCAHSRLHGTEPNSFVCVCLCVWPVEWWTSSSLALWHAAPLCSRLQPLCL